MEYNESDIAHLTMDLRSKLMQFWPTRGSTSGKLFQSDYYVI